MSSAAREKTLVLMRHAKAEEGLGKSDHDRDLNKRGRRDATAAGEWLKENGLVPDLVICSTSHRTRQTWEAACHGGANTEFVEYRRSVYLGGAEQVLETVREDAGQMATVLVVGHNPTMAQLTSLLTDGAGSREAHDALGDGFATSGLAVMRYDGDWADLDLGTCELTRFHVSRG
ncbi:phosphoglycolate phosphatase [Intrasporangium oryzae NRRL B-24470]|uniref:Phosphoglycolate phosphatase n=1 Tax=Intrasporangium oryzae NRRL B-24470 TaxID=1386089 RepID=W9GEC7_9MICO|nr:histidine phosphatase family protein [Intrasporangium oryzae]EWT02229.1 phosphoglycolate phosphatase [Intrasporangium oryzae NRRL B-24470]